MYQNDRRLNYNRDNNRGYNNNGNNNYRNNNNYHRDNNNQQRPRKENMTFSLCDSFKIIQKDNSVIEIPAEVVIDNLKKLQNDGTFEILTENVQVDKSLILGPGKKGFGVIGFINKFDFDAMTVELTIYANTVEKVKEFTRGKKYVLEPKIIHYQGQFKCFNGWFLVESEAPVDSTNETEG